jgi:hypothetical protein
MGSGQTLLPNVYCLGAASTVNGELILDGQGNPNSLFIFKIDGALATTANSQITLTNSASICNVYWQVNGQVELGTNSVFRGTLLVNGAVNLLNGATLYGRALSQAGAISLQTNNVTLSLKPTASQINASGPVTFCQGNSVVLSGNVGGIWSTGATTPSITVSNSGDYYVTNTTSCGSAVSNHIIITVNPLPVCTITGNASICRGQSTQLCVPARAASYLWSTGATTRCITVSTAGTYSVTVTSAGGCVSTCSRVVTVSPKPVCTITGNALICSGQSTQLCVPAGAASYLWSTGATTRCITVSTAGTYSVTVTNASGCVSTCSQVVKVSAKPVCIITGNTSICSGQSTKLCAPLECASYLWSTGATTRCITVSKAGTYSVTVTNSNGASSTCSVFVNFSSSKEKSAKMADSEPELENIDIKIYPNPFKGVATIEYQNKQGRSHIKVELYSLKGIKVANVFEKNLEQYEICNAQIDGGYLLDGIYICKIISGTTIVNKKIILKR